MAKSGEILATGNVKSALGKMAGINFKQLAKAPPGAEAAYRMKWKA